MKHEHAALQALRRRHRAVEEALGRAEREGTDRDAVRQEIVALFRETEALIEELTGFRESIRPLVDRYKEVFRAAPTPPTAAAAAVRVDHLGASTYLERGWSAIAGANYELALRELRRALELAPEDARGQALLGWAEMRLGRLPEARARLEGVLARDPEHGLARTNLGFVCFREGRMAEAIEHLSRAQRGGGDRTAALYANLYLGMVYAEREMLRDALGFFERALEMGPNLTEAYWELGRAHYRAGSHDRALEVWRRGAQANRFNPWGERCEQAAARLAAGDPVSVD
jgi:tetratricopeptide (TPR) repeat protein